MASGVVSFMGVTETLNAYPTYIIAYLSLIHCLIPARQSQAARGTRTVRADTFSLAGAVLLVARRRFGDFQHRRPTATGRRYADWCNRSHGRKRLSPPGERHPRSPDLAHLADGCRPGTPRRAAAPGSCNPRKVNDGNVAGRSRTLLRTHRYGDRQSFLNR